MNKKHFSKYIAENLNISSKHANLLIDAFTTNLSQAIFEGHSVSLDEFGDFIPVETIASNKAQPKVNRAVKFLPGSLLSPNINITINSNSNKKAS